MLVIDDEPMTSHGLDGRALRNGRDEPPSYLTLDFFSRQPGNDKFSGVKLVIACNGLLLTNGDIYDNENAPIG